MTPSQRLLTTAANDLRDFSPAIGMAFDLNELRAEMLQLERGARFGEDLASFTETKGDAERLFKQWTDEILAQMLVIWRDVEPLVREGLEWSKFQAKTLGDLMKLVNTFPTPFKVATGLLATISETHRKMLGITELEAELKEYERDPLAELFIDYGLAPKPGALFAPGKMGI